MAGVTSFLKKKKDKYPQFTKTLSLHVYSAIKLEYFSLQSSFYSRIKNIELKNDDVTCTT